MESIETANNSEVLERLDRLERSFTESLRVLELRLAVAEPLSRVFNDGLEAYRTRLLHQNRQGRVRQELLTRINTDGELRFPHRKILDFLGGEYDYNKDEFKEVNFSRLVKECRIGKNRAQGYLSVLVRKGLVTRRTDGYRIFFRIAAPR